VPLLVLTYLIISNNPIQLAGMRETDRKYNFWRIISYIYLEEKDTDEEINYGK